MKKSRRFLALSLALVVGGGFFGVQSYGLGTTLVVVCFRGRTIQVPYYMRNTYIAQGAMDGACPTTQ